MAEKTLVLRFKSEVAQAKEGISELRTGITGIFSGVPGSLSSTFSGAAQSLSAMQGIVGQLLPGLTAITDTARAAIELAEFAAERQELHERVSTETLGGLRQATSGLLSDTRLLKVAQQSMTGDFGLLRSELMTVASAARVLSDEQQKSIDEVLPALLDALQRGQARGLAPYGVIVEDTTSKSDAFRQMLEKLTAVAQSAGDVTLDTGDKIQRMRVATENATDAGKEFIGTLVIGLGEISGMIWEGIIDGITGTNAAMRDALGSGATFTEAMLSLSDAGAAVVARVHAANETIAETNRLINEGLIIARRAGIQAKEDAETRQKVDKLIAQGLDALERGQTRATDIMKRESERRRALLIEERQEWSAFDDALDESGAKLIANLRKQSDAFDDYDEGWERVKAGFRDVGGLPGRLIDDLAISLEGLREEMAELSDVEVPKWKADLADMSQGIDNWSNFLNERGVNALVQFSDAAGNAYGMILRGQVGVAEGAMEVVEQLLIAEAVHAFSLAVKSALVALYNVAIGNFAGASAAASASAGLFAYAAASGLVGGAIAQSGGGGAQASLGGDTGAGGGRGNQEGRGFGGGAGGGAVTNVVVNNYLGYGFVGDEQSLGRKLVPIIEGAISRGTVRELRGAARRVREH